MSETVLKVVKIIAVVVAVAVGALIYNYINGEGGVWGPSREKTATNPKGSGGDPVAGNKMQEENGGEDSTLPELTDERGGGSYKVGADSFGGAAEGDETGDDQHNSAGFTVKTKTFEPDDNGNIEIIWGDGVKDSIDNPKEQGKKSTQANSDDIPDNWQLAEDQSIDNHNSEVSVGKGSNRVAERSDSGSKRSEQKQKTMANSSESKLASQSSKKGSEAKDKAKKAMEDYDGKEPLNNVLKDFELNIDYEKLLKNPSELGFTPTADLFRDAYVRIRTSFVEEVNDDRLAKGVMTEVGKLARAAGQSVEPLHKLDKNKNILTQILNAYGSTIDKKLLTYAAVEGMLYGLRDPFSVLMTPKEYDSLKEQIQSQGFGGIGVYIEADKDDNNQVTVFEPMEGTPAYKAGVEAGDKILAIDGKSTKGLALDVATKLIRGPVGSKVVLKIKRPGVEQPFNISVTRESIHVISCTSKMYGKVGYVRMRQFGSTTSDELAKEIAKVKSKGANSLILDLRNNGGGFVEAAVGVGGQFIKRGGLIVYTLDRAGHREDLLSKADGHLDMPMLVMINRFSASASEITAGALRDQLHVKLLGERSFGKGSVQQIFPFSDGSAMKMTIARFYSPSGHVIDHNGLIPDITVKMEPRFVGKQGKDTQLQKAIDILSK